MDVPQNSKLASSGMVVANHLQPTITSKAPLLNRSSVLLSPPRLPLNVTWLLLPKIHILLDPNIAGITDVTA
jgi:hypothetical protein